jgi:hypothetical protein
MEPVDLSSVKHLGASSSQQRIQREKTVLTHSRLCKIASGKYHLFPLSKWLMLDTRAHPEEYAPMVGPEDEEFNDESEAAVESATRLRDENLQHEPYRNGDGNAINNGNGEKKPEKDKST